MASRGGSMRARILDGDWSTTPLGPRERWPASLATAVEIMLGATARIAIYWGPELILLYNDAWSELIGEKHPWALGRRCREVFPEIWSRIGPPLLGVLEGRGGFEAHEQLLPLDRSGRIEDAWFDYSLNPIPGEDGAPGGIFNIGVEVTDRVRAARAVTEKTAQLEAEDHRKDLFLATLGHELRNPVATLELTVRLLREGKGEREHLERSLQHDVQQLKGLLNDLLEASRVTRGKLALRKAPMDLSETIRGALEGARGSAQRKGQRILADLPQALPVVADPSRIEQVAANLLGNAVQYTPESGTVRVCLRGEADEAVLTVSDDGRGIAEADLRTIFEPFAQIDPEGGGLGIGLPLARGLVELHGGSLTAESAGLGHGSTFRARIPRGDPSAVPQERRRRLRRLPEELRVVVVDDVQDYADGLAMLLRAQGCDAQAFYSGEALLEEVGRLRPHVVLLDLGLSGMKGYEVAERLRGDDTAAGAWLVAVTGFGDDGAAQKAKAAGFDHRLVKPVDFGLIEQLLLDRAREGL